MFYGVEQSTDMRCPRTKILKFTSEKSALVWKNKSSGHFTYDNPDTARNHHHTFRYIYEYRGKMDTRDKIFKDFGTNTYPLNKEDQVAIYLWKYGSEIKE